MIIPKVAGFESSDHTVLAHVDSRCRLLSLETSLQWSWSWRAAGRPLSFMGYKSWVGRISSRMSLVASPEVGQRHGSCLTRRAFNDITALVRSLLSVGWV